MPLHSFSLSLSPSPSPAPQLRVQQGLSSYILNPLRSRRIWRFAVFLSLAVFAVYWLWSFLSLFPTLRSAWEMHEFYRDKLGIPTRLMQTMEWCVGVAASSPPPHHHMDALCCME